MAAQRTVHCYDYVSQPFPKVQAALHQGAARIFARATKGAAQRERDLAVQLRVRLGMLDVATDVKVEVGPIQETMSSPCGYQVMVLPITWQSAANPGLFPRLKAELLVYPLSRHETQLELEGTYDPRLGLLGEAIDVVVGHRIAEASVLHFLRDVAARLQADITTTALEASATLTASDG
jgi:hypothetical protein